jgi:hypothetical protein
MHINFKSILLVALIILAVLGAFIGGITYGVNTAYKLYSPSFTEMVYTRTASAQIVLEQIDKNKIPEAHSLIRSGLTGDILVLDGVYVDDEKDELRNKISGLLQRVALHRESFPNYYKKQNHETAEVEAAVDERLKKYIKTDKDNS